VQERRQYAQSDSSGDQNLGFMNVRYRDLIKHSGIYALGQFLTRLASIVMLPVHTRYLTPADYGTIAILDLTATVLAILIGAGIAPALARYHQDATSREEEGSIWWTGLTLVAVVTALVLVPLLLFRDVVAAVTLGPHEPQGGRFVALALVTLWFSVLTQVALVYFRLRMWSWSNVTLALAGLLVNVGLNLYFLVELNWGVTGVLLGNLITMAIFCVIRLAIVVRACGRFRFDGPLSRNLVRFGTPIVLTAVLATAMHQADRYLLRLFVDLETVGVYSLAYQIGQGLNSLFLLPFSAVWGVTMYDIARQADAKLAYARIFEYFVYVVLLLLFGVSLFVEPLLRLFATAEYSAAAPLVPIICLSFVFYNLDEHFRVPALLAKRTMSLVPANALGAAANIVLNLLLIPVFGVMAAAWVSVVTYAIFAGVNLVQGRRIDRYDYPLRRCALVLGAMIVTFVLARSLQSAHDGIVWTLGLPTALWCAWAGILAYPAIKHLVRPPAVPAEV
jgi:O-antigen/teichoic acid export membrane protein